MNVIALKEQASGNAEVGTVWTDTAIFDDKDPIMDILNWAAKMSKSKYEEAGRYGRIVITIPKY